MKSRGPFRLLSAGEAFAFLHAQQAWGRTPGAFRQPLVDYVLNWREVGEPWNLLAFNFVVALLLLEPHRERSS